MIVEHYSQCIVKCDCVTVRSNSINNLQTYVEVLLTDLFL